MHKLTRGADIQRVSRQGKRIRGSVVEFRFLPSPLQHVRVAIVVPKHGHTSVGRNRLRRIIREELRLLWPPGGEPVDLVVWAHRGAYEAESAAVRGEVRRLSGRLAESGPR